MSDSLPERPNLDQLRRRAKELRDGVRRMDIGSVERFARHHGNATQGAVTLAAAQLVIARELGFASWPRLKAAVLAHDSSPERRAEAFVAASVEGRMREADSILAAIPDVASHSLEAAAVLGDAQAAARMLAGDPAAAVAVDQVRGWPPLLYACYSRWQRIDPRRASGVAEVVRLLLAGGASANTNDGARYPRSALKGAVEANNPDATRVLLEAGANPNIGQPIAEAAGHGDHQCLKLLLSHGARVARTWALGAAVFRDDAEAVVLLVDALRADAGQAEKEATHALADAVANASREVIGALLAAGADPETAGEHGFSVLRLAVRAGKEEVAAMLANRGVPDDSTDVDRFIGACMRADRRSAEQLLVEHPDLRGRLTDGDRAAVCDAPALKSVAALRLMLDLGFPPNARNDSGEQPLHTAAYHGNAEAVRLLLVAGVDVDARDGRFDASPLAFATVGSGERAGHPGQWVDVVRALTNAGASRDGVWIADKPPSEEVIDLLIGLGVRPDVEPEPQREGLDDLPRSSGTGVMVDIARHLEAAYGSVDLELLGSLLHPEVRWSGQCTTNAEVLDWYRRLLADGTRATVESVEVDGDAVVMGLSVAGQAEGARPAPAERLFQVFTVANDQIVEIRGYADRPSALDRSRS